MGPEFWHSRWATGQIGFHQAEVNPYLQRFWPILEMSAGARVLVPLCGKSVDMTWLCEQGLYVVGVELAEAAAEAYFTERGLQPVIDTRGEFKVYRDDRCEIWCGDFFGLTVADIGVCTGLYDRAALIALPEEMRRRYARQLARLLGADCRGLLVTLDYVQEEIDGPPFAVDSAEVTRLLGEDWQVELIDSQDVLQDNAKFVQRGASRLDEQVYRIIRTGHR